MTKENELRKLAAEYIDRVIDDQRKLGYTSHISKEARNEAVKHAFVALEELACSSHLRDPVAA